MALSSLIPIPTSTTSATTPAAVKMDRQKSCGPSQSPTVPLPTAKIDTQPSRKISVKYFKRSVRYSFCIRSLKVRMLSRFSLTLGERFQHMSEDLRGAQNFYSDDMSFLVHLHVNPGHHLSELCLHTFLSHKI